MNKRKARKLITELQREVSEETVVQQFWMDKVQMYVQLIFGTSENSVALPMFATYYGDRYYNEKGKDYSEKAKITAQKLKELFATYLKAIDNGVYLKRNIFSNDSNGTIAAWAIFVAGIIWLIAYSEGVRSANVDKKENLSTIDSLQRKLSSTNIQLVECKGQVERLQNKK